MVMFTNTSMENKKLEALIHYIVWRSENPALLGTTKLNKALWYSDVVVYIEYGKPITNVLYKKAQFGPVPNPKDFLLAQDNLEKSGKIAITKGLYHNREQTQFVALKKPDISGFSAEEISIVDTIVEYICKNHTASSISELSHDAAWEAAEIGEEIPLYAVFATMIDEINDDDVQWARAEANRLGMLDN